MGWEVRDSGRGMVVGLLRVPFIFDSRDPVFFGRPSALDCGLVCLG